jgi:D-alanine-D-alanine ligase
VRVDLLVTSGENEYVLEVNSVPGMTPTSLLPKIAAGAGYDFGDLCEAILTSARLHQPARRRPTLRTSEVRANGAARHAPAADRLWLVKSVG